MLIFVIIPGVLNKFKNVIMSIGDEKWEKFKVIIFVSMLIKQLSTNLCYFPSNILQTCPAF